VRYQDLIAHTYTGIQ